MKGRTLEAAREDDLLFRIKEFKLNPEPATQFFIIHNSSFIIFFISPATRIPSRRWYPRHP